ncbi:hypothetical protein LINPERHAP1_LOCUS27224 [Linum perenne]
MSGELLCELSWVGIGSTVALCGSSCWVGRECGFSEFFD